MLALLLTSFAGACGNYSNEDLDFQLALPQQSDVEAKLQVAVRADSAQYFQATRSAVTTFNAMALEMLDLVDAVRANTPSTRNGDQRVWGPFPDNKHPGWEVRVVMQRSTVSATQLQMQYWVQVRPVGQGDSAWVSFLDGNYTSQGSARLGQGELHLEVQAARTALYPVDDDAGLRNLDHIDLTYSNADYPITVSMQIVEVPGSNTQSGDYEYQQQQDGSGSMQFTWQGLTQAGTSVSATMEAEWLGSGAGRADLILEPTGLDITLGTDCWGGDTVATYSYRLHDDVTGQVRSDGSAASCLF